jgi:ribosomal protein S18 acetylase RimI-like enzyme
MRVIRAAAEDDVAELVELYRLEVELHESLSGRFRVRPGFDWATLVRTLVAAPERRVFVARAEGRLEGFVHLHTRGLAPAPRPSWRRRVAARLRRRRPPAPADAVVTAPVGMIEDCFVRPELRRRGVATELVRHAVGWLAENGVARVDLMVEADNAPGLAFWESLGFRPSRVILSRRSGP